MKPDKRLREVVMDAFDFCLRNPQEITLTLSGRYMAHSNTPNLIAFSSLLFAVHRYAATHNSPPISFVHDRQQQFGASLREMHRFLSRAYIPEHQLGGFPAKPIAVDYDLGKFSLAASSDQPILQVVDLLLWTLQDTGNKQKLPVKG